MGHDDALYLGSAWVQIKVDFSGYVPEVYNPEFSLFIYLFICCAVWLAGS